MTLFEMIRVYVVPNGHTNIFRREWELSREPGCAVSALDFWVFGGHHTPELREH